MHKVKGKLNYKYNVYLYNTNTREVIKGGDGKFKLPNCQDQEAHKENNIQFIISTYVIWSVTRGGEFNICIYSNTLDIVSNVQQYIGRDRSPVS